MSGENGRGPDIRIRVAPEPEPEELAAIVASLRHRHRAAEALSVEQPSRPASRWARAGRLETMVAREVSDHGITDRS